MDEDVEDGEGKHGMALKEADCTAQDPDVLLHVGKRQKLTQTSGGAGIEATFDKAR